MKKFITAALTIAVLFGVSLNVFAEHAVKKPDTGIEAMANEQTKVSMAVDNTPDRMASAKEADVFNIKLNSSTNITIAGNDGYKKCYFKPTKTKAYLFTVSTTPFADRYITDSEVNLLKWQSYLRAGGYTRMITPILTAGKTYIFWVYNPESAAVTRKVGLYDDIWMGVNQFRNSQFGTIVPGSKSLEMDLYKVSITKAGIYSFADNQGDYKKKSICIFNEAGEDMEGLQGVNNGSLSYNISLKPGNYYLGVGALGGNAISYNITMIDKTNEITGISLDKKLKLYMGESKTLAVGHKPIEAEPPSVTFWSSNEAVAVVNSTGKVTAVKAGNAVILARTLDEKYSALCNVTVDAEISAISLDKSKLKLHIGKSETLKAAYKPVISDKDYPIAWSSANPKVVSIDKNGRVYAQAVGKTVITVKSSNGTTAECSVTVEGHSYKNIITKATLTTNGSIAKKCPLCGRIDSSKTIYYPKSISLSTTVYTYNGNAKKPSVSVKGSNGKTISSSNYTLSNATGRKSVGKYNIKVTFKGSNYSGSVTKSFTILPKGTSITKLSQGFRSLTVMWRQQNKQTNGYQVQYSTNNNFNAGTTTTSTITKNSTTTKTLQYLRAWNKYYVRVRTYKNVKVDEKLTTLYSEWSNVNSVTMKW